MLKAIVYFLLIEALQIIFVVIFCHLIWRFVLKNRLPKAWVDNLTMMGFVPNKAA